MFFKKKKAAPPPPKKAIKATPKAKAEETAPSRPSSKPPMAHVRIQTAEGRRRALTHSIKK